MAAQDQRTEINIFQINNNLPMCTQVKYIRLFILSCTHSRCYNERNSRMGHNIMRLINLICTYKHIMYIIVKYITSSVFNLYNMVGAVIYSSSQGNNATTCVLLLNCFISRLCLQFICF